MQQLQPCLINQTLPKQSMAQDDVVAAGMAVLNIQNVFFGGAWGVLCSVSPDVAQRRGGSLWLSQGDVAGLREGFVFILTQ